MSNSKNRRVVNVVLLDQDAGLNVENSVVVDFGNVVTEDDNQTLIQQLIVDYNLKELIDEHNVLRTKTVDVELQKRTGQTCYLQPIKLKDLHWSLK